LTSEETNRAVEQHLEGYEDCRKVLALMQGEGGPAADGESETKEIDYLKKVRAGTWKRVIAGILAAAFVIGAGVWIRVYRYGSDADPSAVNIVSVDQGEDRIAISGNFKDKSLGVTHTDMLLKGEGILELGYRSAPKKGLDNEFSFVAQGEGYGDVQEIRMGDRIVWYHGALIDEQTSNAYNARHAYVGDMPANGRLAAALGIQEEFGSYENELSTGQEPYGWTFYFQRDFSSKELADGRRAHLHRDAAVLLACVDNLDWVEFRFTSSGKPLSIRLTAEEASLIRNADIKKEAADPARLQLLMDEWPNPVYYTVTE
ncbi:MAG: DUF4825 domain-containing protein, partial [Firmicutes bacterium]|nr:DUF4825 domain-containing protein [Bacillota bacterium]